MEVCLLNLIINLLCGLSSELQPDYYGEPVQLKGNYIYFTSWKYVRQGSFRWKAQFDDNASEAQTAWLKGDGLSRLGIEGMHSLEGQPDA